MMNLPLGRCSYCRRLSLSLSLQSTPNHVLLDLSHNSRGRSMLISSSLVIPHAGSSRCNISSAPHRHKQVPAKHRPMPLPRLTPTSFPSLDDESHPTPQSRRHRAILLTRLLTQVHDPSVSTDEIYNSYRRLLDLPGGGSLVSPPELQSVIHRLSTWPKNSPGVPAKIAFARVSLILEGVRRLKSALVRSGGGRTREAAQWTALLLSPQLQTQLIWLVTGSHRDPDLEDLKEVVKILRRGFGWDMPQGDNAEEALSPRASGRRQHLLHGLGPRDRVSHNLVLDLIARIARKPTPHNIVYDRADDVLSPTATARLVEELPLKRLVISALSKHERGTGQSLERMSQLFYSLWHDMQAYGRLGTDKFSWSSRIRLESKLATRDLFLTLDEVPRGASTKIIEEVFEKNRALPGWLVIQQTLKDALASGSLHISHIEQVIWQYSRLHSSVSVFSEEQGYPNAFSLVMTLFLRANPDTKDVVWELYEMLRWNEVQLEMEKLRKLRASSSSGRSSAKDALSGSRTDASGPVAALLGISLPRVMIASDTTYAVLVRHYAIGEGDYEKAARILEDYKESGVEEINKPDREFSSLPSSHPGREVNMSLLDPFLVGFSLRGVASEEAEDGDWHVVGEERGDGDAVGSAARSGWRLSNLLPLLDMLLQLTSPKEAKVRQEKARYAHLHASLTNGAGSTTSSARSTTATVNDSLDESSSRTPQEFDAADVDSLALSSILSSLPINLTRPQRARGPTARQLYFILTALRRCTGDRRPDLVLRYWRELEYKFGFKREEEEQEKNRERELQRQLRLQQAKDQGKTTVKGKGQTRPTSAAAAAARSHDHLSMFDSSSSQTTRDLDGKRNPTLADSTYPANSQGWIGWTLDQRLKRLIPYLEERADELLQRQQQAQQERQRQQQQEEEEEQRHMGDDEQR